MSWFAFDGLDTLNNGMALYVLHHKLFDIGALGLDQGYEFREVPDGLAGLLADSLLPNATRCQTQPLPSGHAGWAAQD